MRHLDHPRCDTLNAWCSVEAHFHHLAGSMSHPLSPLKQANTSVMTICNQSLLRVTMMQVQKSWMLRWCSFQGWCREFVSSFFDYKGGQYIRNEQWYTIVNISRSIVWYLNATMNGTTRNAEPEIGHDRSIQTQRNLRDDKYGTVIGPPWSSGSGFGQVWDQTDPSFLCKSGPLAGYPALLLTLLAIPLSQHTSPPSLAKTSPRLGRLQFCIDFIIAYLWDSADLWGEYLILTLLNTTWHWHQPVVPISWPLSFFPVVVCQLRQFTIFSTSKYTWGINAQRFNDEFFWGLHTPTHNTRRGYKNPHLRHMCTGMSCTHTHINSLKQQKSLDTLYSTELPTEHSWGIPLQSHHRAPCAWSMQYWIWTVSFLGED